MNRECSQCGNRFRYPAGANHAGKYCSRQCMSAAFSQKTIHPCGTCGIAVERKPAEVKQTVFCSHACYAQSLKGKPSEKNTRILLACETCGEQTEVKAYRLKTFRFCSRPCYLKWHSSDNTTPELNLLRSSAAYREWRTAVFQRDDYTCQLCGVRGGALNADHIKTFAHHPELRLDLDNGQTLCVPCHRETDTYGTKAWRNHGRAVDATGY